MEYNDNGWTIRKKIWFWNKISGLLHIYTCRSRRTYHFGTYVAILIRLNNNSCSSSYNVHFIDSSTLYVSSNVINFYIPNNLFFAIDIRFGGKILRIDRFIVVILREWRGSNLSSEFSRLYLVGAREETPFSWISKGVPYS